MELPHLTVYLRRYRRHAKRGLLIFAAYWLILCILMFAVPRSGQQPGSMLVWGADVAALFVWLAAMANVCRFLAQGALQAVTLNPDVPPAWMATPLSSATAALGMAAASLISAWPNVVVLLPALLIYAFRYEPQMNVASQAWLPLQLVLILMRLPSFALAALCLALALRDSRFVRLLPTVLAVTGALLIFWDARIIGAAYESGGSSAFIPNVPGDVQLYMVLAVAASGGWMLLLITASSFRRRPLLTALLEAVLACQALAALAIAVVAFSSDAYNPASTETLLFELFFNASAMPWHLTFSATYPAVLPIPTFSNNAWLYDLYETQYWGVRLLVVFNLATLCMWWAATVACFNGARRLKSPLASAVVD